MSYRYAILKEQEEKINPKIAKEVKAVFKPYEKLIQETEGLYKLEVLARQASSINLKIDDDVLRFFQIYLEIVINRICRKIRLHYKKDRNPDFSLRDVEAIMKENGIGQDFRNVITNAITTPMAANLSLGDCYMAFKHCTKITSFKMDCSHSLPAKIKSKFTKAKSAIIVIYGTHKTTLEQLHNYWKLIADTLAENIPIGFSYDVKNKLKKEKMYALVGY